MSALLMRLQDEHVIELKPTVRLVLADETILELTMHKKLLVYENQSRRSFSFGEIFKVHNQFFAFLDTTEPFSLIVPANKEQLLETLPGLHQNFMSFVQSCFSELSRIISGWSKATIWSGVARLRNLISAALLFSLAWQGLSTNSRAEAPPLRIDQARETSKTRMFATVSLLEKNLEAREKFDNAAKEKSLGEMQSASTLAARTRVNKSLGSNTIKVAQKGRAHKSPCSSLLPPVLDPDVLRFLPPAERARLTQRTSKTHIECEP